MIIFLINKILIVLYLLSCLTTLRHMYYFIQAYIKTTPENQIQYKISKNALLFLAISISYIVSGLFLNIKL